MYKMIKNSKRVAPTSEVDKTALRYLKKTYPNEYDDYFGYMFQIEPHQLSEVKNYLYGFHLTLNEDKYNKGWYYLSSTK